MILAGGASKRMGNKNKAFLKIGEKSIIERVLDAISVVVPQVILITNSPEQFIHLNRPLYQDILPGNGPLGGIYTGLINSTTNYDLVVACDMPYIQSQLLRLLINYSQDYDIVIPSTPDGYHPLCAIYSKACIDPIEKLVNDGSLKVTNLFNYVKVKEVKLTEIYPEFDLNVLLNINTDQDYEKALAISSQYN